uniref:Meiotic nuclear division protein 1 homolog n=1 Tax=Mesocestoides corti TaxID=53468 RepID=A0A5K3FC65_MESCO
MSKKRGLSLEEKREKMTEFFHEKKDFFTLKELERLCPKEKGIPSMTVKDVLMSLVYDGIVDTDKIGTSVYFWAFPSKAGQNRRKKIEDLRNELSQTESRLQSVLRALSEAKVGKEDTVDRVETISTLGANESLLQELNNELSQLQKYHPDRLHAVQSQTKTATESANRWTDNIFQVTCWAKEKFGVDESTLLKQFRVPENFDYYDN